jgi:hypothetical protein
MNRAYARIECNGQTFPVLDAPRGSRQSNWFEMAPAGHPSEGRVIMRAVDYRLLEQAQTDEVVADLVFGTTSQSGEIADERVKVQVRALGATPFVTSLNQDVNYVTDSEDSVEVTLVSKSWWTERNTATDANYNVQDGFALTGGVPTFRSDASNVKKTASWSELPLTFGYTVGQSVDFVAPPVELRNLHCIGRPRSETGRRIADGLGLIFDPTSKKIWNKGQVSTSNLALAIAFSTRVAEANFQNVSDDRYPTQVKVGFTSVGSPTPEAIKYYTKSTPRGSGTIPRSISVGHWFAFVDSTGTTVNNTELGNVADWFSTGKGNALDIQTAFGSQRFAGIVNFTIDGLFRRVLWVCNAHDVSTTVSVNHSIPFRAREEPTYEWFASHPVVTSRSLDGTTLALATSESSSGFDAIVTGSASIGSNRWKYSWVSATLVNDKWQKDNPPRLQGTLTTDYAINKNENANTGSWAGPGVIVSTAQGYPTTWKVIAVGKDRNNVQYDYAVTMYKSVRADGSGQYWFHVENAHDGACP